MNESDFLCLFLLVVCFILFLLLLNFLYLFFFVLNLILKEESTRILNKSEGRTQPSFMKYHGLLHKFHYCKFMDAILLAYKKHMSWNQGTLYYISIKKNCCWSNQN